MDIVGAGDRWIPEEDYQQIVSRVPITCVDLLPIMDDEGKFGLIRRKTYNGGHGLCLVGGAVIIDETLDEALDRHVRATLGPDVCLDLGSLELVGIYQYFKNRTDQQLHDPRKNAIAITYTGRISGKIETEGEAEEFRTFQLSEPPPHGDFGFGQGAVAYDALAKLGARIGVESN